MSQAPGVAVFTDDGDPFPGKAERQQGCSQMVDLAPEFGVSPHRQRFIDLVPERKAGRLAYKAALCSIISRKVAKERVWK
jgi:hypothetical protein